MSSRFSDKVVVITGAGGVLGKVMAVSLAKEGAKVAMLDINESAAKEAADMIVKSGGNAMGVACNVLDPSSLQSAREVVNSQLGSCDILINGAGGNHPSGTTAQPFLLQEHLDNAESRTFFDLKPSDFKFVFDLNFLGTFLPTQVFAHEMVRRERGVIVNISSMNAFRPLTKIPAYSSAKAAVSNFTQWLAVYFARTGIRVNAIAPGFFLTVQTKFLLTQEDGSLSERGKAVIQHTPMGRFGDPEELIGTLFWLCSDDSRFVTGIVVPVDGGFSAYSGV